MKKNESNPHIPLTNTEMVEYTKVKSVTIKAFSIIMIIFLVLTIITLTTFYLIFSNKQTISNGVFIKDIDVSGLTKKEAIEKVQSHLDEIMNDTVTLDYNNKQYYVEVEQIEATFDIESAVDTAFSIGRNGNIFSDVKSYVIANVGGVVIDPTLVYNEEALNQYIEDIQSRLPDQLQQYNYSIEDESHLIITSGKYGAVIYKEQLKEHILETIQDISYNDKALSIPTYKVYPDKIDVQKIHDEVYKEVKDAFFTREPYTVVASVTGVDFDVESVNKYIEENPKLEEYDIKLNLTYPRVTVNDLGYDPFPNVISTFSTSYVNNAARTTNLRLAASKINGVVVMPGETFSYNRVVGKRTVEAGYKDAAIYQNGQVVDGLGGGICQISSTLYNAAVAADMEIMQRRNHQFVPSYVSAGYDATVVWGSTDFQFLNRRDYPVKIEASVNGGIARITFHGLKKDNEPTCSIETVTIKNTSKSIVVDSYRVYRQNGKEIKRSKMYRDTYSKH